MSREAAVLCVCGDGGVCVVMLLCGGVRVCGVVWVSGGGGVGCDGVW